MGGGGPDDFWTFDMEKKPVTIIKLQSGHELPTVIVAAFFARKQYR